MAGKAPRSTPERTPLVPGPDGIVRLSGGNPQIAKGDGDAVVQRYIAAMPGWQRGIGETMDAIISREAPDAIRCVRWNSPFYGSEPGRWFVSFHCMTAYVKIAFPDGIDLDPIPPGTSKQARVRYYDVRENGFDAELFASWIRQAMRLPGERF
ncbi:DUF1801 domain-containing protein [Arsenicitalea aurantiaca]|uniref:DUF1801 domain-containing protein n=1 Tax=Arsenicitalea aurantiaca TaxID=1783274 RepID=A0A433XJX8_9HYPH|nr:DUF1801 domain-containing protein [Arsenicitalea aurantiaca]RUT34397.1 DUF1801 domain-containing protein [Arsenicitalea aurantiaca]